MGSVCILFGLEFDKLVHSANYYDVRGASGAMYKPECRLRWHRHAPSQLRRHYTGRATGAETKSAVPRLKSMVPAPVRISVLAVGSRGEVEPLIALGHGLRSAEHEVTLATHRSFEGLTREQDLGFAPLWGGPEEAIQTEAGQRLIHSGYNIVRAGRALFELLNQASQRMFDDCWKACQGADAIVFGQIAVVGPHIACKLRIPAVGAYVNPIHPARATRAFPAPGAPPWGLGRWYNGLSHHLVMMGFASLWWANLNAWRRRRLGFGPVSLRRVLAHRYPIVYGFSPTLIAKPREWGSSTHVSGYWFLNPPRDWRAPADLIDFLEAGPPPIFLGFGTMQDSGGSMTKIVLDALSDTGERGIVLSGPEEQDDARVENVYRTESIPFRWLFPRVAAVVHHGGLGTSHCAARAGVPQITVPFMGDQYFWGNRLWQLGVAHRPLSRRSVRATALALAIKTALSDPAMRQRATDCARRMTAEEGVARAVAFIEEWLSRQC
jgi:sterol 3beta-glucosyltransferase